jgi:hypothetical protein
VLFFIELGRRRVHLAGCTARPDEASVTQQARQVSWGLVERKEAVRFLIRDRDRTFTSRCDAAVFEAQGRACGSDAAAGSGGERNRGTLRGPAVGMSRLAVDPEHAAPEHTLEVLVDHYNSGRSHGSLGLVPPNGRPPVAPKVIGDAIKVRQGDRLGGLLHEYQRAA